MSTNTLAGGTYNLQSQGTGFGQIGSVSDLRLTLANGVIATAGANGGTTTNPQINRTGLSAANLTNTFFIGSVNPAFTSLPVTLLYFKGALADNQVDLFWASAFQQEGDWFIVQRSKDGHSWETLEKLSSSAVTNDPNEVISGTSYSYSVTDPAPYSGTSFYRLQQEDADGNSSYSSILSFQRNIASGNIIVSPIPAVDHLTVSFPATGKYTVMLLNSAGQLMREPLASTGYNVTWQVSGLPAGPYFIRISHDGITESRTVLIR
jgi:hypothetical protein